MLHDKVPHRPSISVFVFRHFPLKQTPKITPLRRLARFFRKREFLAEHTGPGSSFHATLSRDWPVVKRRPRHVPPPVIKATCRQCPIIPFVSRPCNGYRCRTSLHMDTRVRFVQTARTHGRNDRDAKGDAISSHLGQCMHTYTHATRTLRP